MYSQPREIWNSFDSDHQARVISRFASELVHVQIQIRNRFLGQIERIDSEFRVKLEEEIEKMSNEGSSGPPSPTDSKPKASPRSKSNRSRSVPKTFSSLLADFRSNVLKSIRSKNKFRG